MYVVDNNLLDEYYTSEIVKLLKEYSENRYTLATGDVISLKKLESIVTSAKETGSTAITANGNNSAKTVKDSDSQARGETNP